MSDNTASERLNILGKVSSKECSRGQHTAIRWDDRIKRTVCDDCGSNYVPVIYHVETCTTCSERGVSYCREYRDMGGKFTPTIPD